MYKDGLASRSNNWIIKLKPILISHCFSLPKKGSSVINIIFMENHLCISFFICLFILTSCLNSANNKYKAFTEKKGQSSSERIIRDLSPYDSLNTTKSFDGRSFEDIDHNRVSNIAQVGDKIVKLTKQDLSLEKAFTIPQGRGPGEVINFDVAYFNIGEEEIAIYDGKAKKKQCFMI
jgi:hypothetical protein